MKIHDILEGRRNPAQNPKETLQHFIEKHETTEGHLFVSFQNLKKLGSNPKSTWETPAGVYAYPFSYVLERGKRRGFESPAVVPYGSSSKYCYLFKHEGKMLNVTDPQHLEQLTSQVKTLFSADESMSDEEKSQQIEDEFIAMRNKINEDDEFSNLLAIIKVKVGAATYEPNSASKIHHKYPDNGVNSGPYAVSAFFIKHGWTGLIDFGHGFIYSTEPTQAVFFHGIKVVDMAVLTRTDEKQQNKVNIQTQLGNVEVKRENDETPLADIATSLHRAMKDLLFAIDSSSVKDGKRLMRVFRNQFNKIRRNIISHLDVKHFKFKDEERMRQWTEDEIAIIKDPENLEKLDHLIDQFNSLIDFLKSAKFTNLVASIRTSKEGIFHSDYDFMNAILSPVGEHTIIPMHVFHRIFDLSKNTNISYPRLTTQINTLVKRHIHNELDSLFTEFMEAARSLANRPT